MVILTGNIYRVLLRVRTCAFDELKIRGCAYWPLCQALHLHYLVSSVSLPVLMMMMMMIIVLLLIMILQMKKLGHGEVK